jgi:hypothetical protein
LDFLDDYWSRFLMRHVQLDSTPRVATSPAEPPKSRSAAAPAEAIPDSAEQRRSAWQRVRDLVPIRK